ncbi:MAG: class I SAM-dependent methyltransferase [Desulfobacterales bacterium]|nr:class I SAM-dependent methyltransferase [Desulfobacterales bacterium]MBF0397263.1 class I SAM-dependent methyltransferase [Desulfobacterales bacterium]
MLTIDDKKICIKPNSKILDVGCGTGRHTAHALKFKDVITIGVDLNLNDLIKAEERIKFHKEMGEYDGKCHLLSIANTLNLPFRDNVFDVVICCEVMEHILNHRQVAYELVRVLKKGGMLVISVPRYFPERICWTLSKDYNSASSGHVRIYKKNELKLLLEKAGVKFLEYHFAHSLHTPYWWLKCIVKEKDSAIVRIYHRFLVWDLMKNPWITRFLDKLLNPIMGKSIVFYLRKSKNV